jgi:hypothetical protein
MYQMIPFDMPYRCCAKAEIQGFRQTVMWSRGEHDRPIELKIKNCVKGPFFQAFLTLRRLSLNATLSSLGYDGQHVAVN